MKLEEWTKVKINQFGEIITGSTPDTKNIGYWGGNIPFVSPADFRFSVFVKKTERTLTEQGVRQSRLIPEASILVTCIGSIGGIAIASCNCVTNQQINSVVCNDNIDDLFAYFLIQNNLFKLKELAGITTLPIINKTVFGNIELLCPTSIKEQEKIAEVLSTIDRAIEQTEAIIAKQQRIKTGLMQDLLTKGIDEDGNVRSEDTHEFKDSLLGQIPVEWEVNPLYKLANHVIDCPHTTPNFLEGGVLTARTFNISDGVFDFGSASFVSESEYVERISRLEPQYGDIIFTREAPVGEAFVIPKGMKICLGQRTMLIRCDEAFLNPNYLLESLYSEDMRIRFDRMVGGTTNPHLNVADVRELLVKQPKTKEQIRITNVLAEIRSSLSATQDQRSKLQLTKTGLMQDLLTGKVRVTELLKDAAAASP